MRKETKRGTIRSKIKRGDQVVFVAGKEFNRYDSNGKRNPHRGKVIAVDPRTRKVKVEGAMIVKKHQKPNPQLNIEGGILSREAWVTVSNVALVDPKTGEPTRISYELRDGKKVRVARKSGTIIPEPGIFVKPEADETEEPDVSKEPAGETEKKKAKPAKTETGEVKATAKKKVTKEKEKKAKDE